MIVLRCVCGRPVGELRGDSSGVLSLPCFRCRDVLWQYGLEKRVAKGRLLVMQSWDLRSGDLTRTECFQDHASGDRSRDRGGERLDVGMLEAALRRMRARPRS